MLISVYPFKALCRMSFNLWRNLEIDFIQNRNDCYNTEITKWNTNKYVLLNVLLSENLENGWSDFANSFVEFVMVRKIWKKSKAKQGLRGSLVSNKRYQTNQAKLLGSRYFNQELSYFIFIVRYIFYDITANLI